MRISYLGFVLLIWFPGALHGQSAPQSCSAPSLDGGFFAPKEETYPHGAQLAYTCGTGRKATVKGWWATSTCQNGKWSHELQCIDEKACIPPTIPHAKYTENSNGWYEEGHIIITCDKGYQDKNQDATAECINGTWSSVPVCEKSLQACGAPPKIPHTVIINQEYQDVFAADSEVKYECENGYTVEGTDTKKKIICIAGNWTTGPPCSSGTRPGTGHGGRTQPTGGGSGTRPGTGHGDRTQPTGGGSGTRPGTGHGGRTQPTGGGSGTRPGTGHGDRTQPTGGGSGTRPGTGHGDRTQPTGGGSSVSSGSNGREGGTQFTTIDKCGRFPQISDGDVVEKHEMSIKYRCSSFHKLVGRETVSCYSNGTWSEVPTCKAAYCSVDTAEKDGFQSVGVVFLEYGERKRFECVKPYRWSLPHYSFGLCTYRRMRFTGFSSDV
ncbi:complement factor H-like [Thunnus albacares]|uniref:complement factor H-like n=1 Tax=Thunnus albacares TaxID=8236 RepID=UPI001CF679AA|nr:complement factor H-like [Thunnus albacares]